MGSQRVMHLFHKSILDQPALGYRAGDTCTTFRLFPTVHVLRTDSTFFFSFLHSITMINQRKPQNLSEAKLNRLLEYNQRLRELLDIPRITVSEASTR